MHFLIQIRLRPIAVENSDSICTRESTKDIRRNLPCFALSRAVAVSWKQGRVQKLILSESGNFIEIFLHRL